MNNEFLSDSDTGFEDENPENQILWRLPKRYIRDWENPVEFFEDVPFRKRYRFSKGAVIEILLPLVSDQLRRLNNRGLPISPLMQLLIALRFYATSSFQIVNGDLRGYSQASVSRVVARVSRILASYVVAGPQREILDIVVRHPGSTHDAVIFDRSGLRCRFEQRYLNGILLGDSGYACRSYLLTPVLRPERDPEVRYNTAHKKTRVIVEQLFGVWKRRFPCLYNGLRTKLSTSVSIVCATAVLHNLCIQHNLGEINEEQFNENILFDDIINREQNGIGFAHRNAFILRHFS
ncbi:putative nuclease HARBI1 [Temnothorax nylanderi]|uniref:putative nuclease HARBI1 n=1 Tax=Temnothorax nylanderi TaxID=102681 RepID=UPI003A8505B8